MLFVPAPAVSQKYVTGGADAYVIVGNAALVKCEVPSFVADFVSVDGWVDSQGGQYYKSDSYGNFGALFKC